MEGLLIIDKPVGPTSHDVVAHVRRASGVRRVGHAGTLDPLASGVLIVCIGRATRLLEYVVGRPKTYEGVVRLGETTSTYDAEGEVIATAPVPPLSPAVLEALLADFRGEIDQIPPIYSAIKKDGQPLYKLARRGEQVDITPRQVHIYDLTIAAWEPPDLRLRITCSTGTYIRSLAHDIGQAAGCGGYLAALRRLAVGQFSLAESVPLQELRADNILFHLRRPETAVDHLPRLQVTAAEQDDLLQGRALPTLPAHPDAATAAVFNPSGQFTGIASREGDTWRPHKNFPPDA